MSSDFADLLYEAEKLTTTIEGVTELPKVSRSLQQVLEDSKDLYARVAQSGAQDVQANLLLGSQGIDLPRITQKLENISTKHTLEPLKPTVDTDVESYLENYVQTTIISALDEEFTRCAKVANVNAWEHQKSEWTKQKNNALNSMTAPSHSLLITDKHSVFGDKNPVLSVALGYQETLYAAKVIEYNKSVIEGYQRPNLITIFSNVAKEFKDHKVNDIWEALKYMTDLPPFPQNESAAKIRNNKHIIKTLITQAKRFLEDRYKTYMTNIINENLAEARRGGVPGTYSLVRSFVGIRLQGEYSGLEGGMVDDRPVWPVVYYCLRSGDITAAIHCLKKSTAKVDNVIALLETKFKNPNSAEIGTLETNLKYEYRRTTHNSTDPFHRIVYDILSCSDATDEHSEVAKTADDYLWLKLSYLRINSEQDDSEAYRNLQSTILEVYGETHYDALNQPHLYFQMLILTGQFEAALEFLSRTERYYIHGLHMAIALNELHMLALSYHHSCPLISIDPDDPKPSRTLNMYRIITQFTEKIEYDAPKEAIHYYHMLRNISDQNYSMFVACVIDLAVEIRKYEMLFGKMQRSGLRSKGFLDEFASSDVKVEKIAEAVAKILMNKGLFEDALELFDIANNQEEVLNILCTLLSQVVHLQVVDGSLRQRLPHKVDEIANRYSAVGYNCTAKTMSSFIILKELLKFFDQYHAKQFPSALKTLHELNIIPLRENEIEERVNCFKKLNLNVSKVLPDIILATINILFAQYQKLKGNEYIPTKFAVESQDKQLTFLREQAKCLISFTGKLPYQMPGDTNSRLVQMEILMH